MKSEDKELLENFVGNAPPDSNGMFGIRITKATDDKFMTEPVTDDFVLNPQSEFEAAVARVVSMFRSKNAAYARPCMDEFQGFIDIAEDAEQTPLQAVATLSAKHRLSVRRYLRTRERDAGTDDGHMDGAVYAIIALALYERGEFNG